MIVPGTVVEGRVESLMPYGAFVDLGDGLSGLVHISQISQKRLKKPSEVLTVGDTVRAVVLIRRTTGSAEHQGSSRERRAGRAGRKTGGRVQLE